DDLITLTAVVNRVQGCKLSERDGRLPEDTFFAVCKVGIGCTAREGVVRQEADIAEITVRVKVALAFAHVIEPVNDGRLSYLVFFASPLVSNSSFNLLPLGLELDVFVAEAVERMIEVFRKTVNESFQLGVAEGHSRKFIPKCQFSRIHNLDFCRR